MAQWVIVALWLAALAMSLQAVMLIEQTRRDLRLRARLSFDGGAAWVYVDYLRKAVIPLIAGGFVLLPWSGALSAVIGLGLLAAVLARLLPWASIEDRAYQTGWLMTLWFGLIVGGHLFDRWIL